MKKSLVSFLIGSLLLIPLQIANAATPKAGAICTKLKQVLTVGDYKFTCIKSGKKLVWNRAVVDKKPTLTPSPLPEPTSYPAPTPSPSPTPIKTLDPKYPVQGQPCPRNSVDVVGYDPKGLLVDLMCNQFDDHYFPRPDNLKPFKVDQLTGLPIPKDLHEFLLEPLVNDWTNDKTGNLSILTKALDLVRNSKSIGKSPELIVFQEPGTNPKVLENGIISAKLELANFADVLPNMKKFYLVIARTKDFATKSYEQISLAENDPTVMDPNGMVMGGLTAALSSPESKYFRGGAITSGHPGKSFGLTTFYEQGPISAIYSSNDDSFIIPGELKHAIFYSITNGYQLSPCFMTPGNLGVFGAAFAHPDWNEKDQLLYLISAESLKNAQETPLFKTLDITTLDGNNGRIFDGTECGIKGDYVITPFAVAYLISKYGLESEFKYLQLFGQNPNNWQDIFKQVYGISVSQFASEVKPFLEWYRDWFAQNFGM